MWFLSDSSDDGAVEDLVNQAIDDSILDQIAKINCSTDSVLPTHLENRFSRLKTFPLSNPPTSVALCEPKFVDETESKMGSRSDYLLSQPMGRNEISDLRMNLGSSSPSNSSTIGSPLGENSGERKVVKSKSRSNSYDSSQSPKKSGCFWCSSKWGSRKNRKGESGIGDGQVFISDLSVFSAKKQHKLLEKVLREEDKISREAEKIVNLVKQGSARINISDIGPY